MKTIALKSPILGDFYCNNLFVTKWSAESRFSEPMFWDHRRNRRNSGRTV